MYEHILNSPEVQKYVKHCVEEHLPTFLNKNKELVMSDGVSDKVDVHNIFKGMGESGGGFGSGGMLGGLLVGALLGRNGGLFGGNGEGTAATNAITSDVVLSKLGDIQASVPLAEAQVQLALAGTQNALQSAMAANQAATIDAAAGVKDAVNSGAILNMQTTQNSSKEILAAIAGLGNKMDQATIANLQAELAEVRSSGRARDVEVNVTQQVNQQQQQAQQQQQFGTLINILSDLGQSIRATNQAINIGGTLTANPTNTNNNTRVN